MPDHPLPHPELAGYVLGVLEPREAEAFEEHLAVCADCREEVGELSGVRRLLEEAEPPVEVPPGLGARTLEAVERAAQAQHARVRRRRLGSVAAAVALVAGLAGATVGLVGLVGDDDAGGRELRLVATTVGSGRGVAVVDGTDRGTIVRLELSDLAPTRNGAFYECWYIGEEDTPEHPDRVSAGSFTVGPDGRARVTMITAARFEEYPRMAITLEPGDGNPVATGPEVLVPD